MHSKFFTSQLPLNLEVKTEVVQVKLGEQMLLVQERILIYIKLRPLIKGIVNL
jgi:hypothetical protein